MTRWKLAMACTTAAVVALLAVTASRVAGDRGKNPRHGEQHKNMKLVGLDDLQARSAYQPIVHRQAGRWIAYIGHHAGEALNPLARPRPVIETNGTSIVDVTNPRRPVYLHHIQGPAGVGEAGGAQMVRACSGSELPHADQTKHYLLRATLNAHEVYDVTDPSNPVLLTTVVGHLGDTHKSWWECDTGIAYLVSDGTSLATAIPSFPAWRTSRMTQIFDLSNPAQPIFIRNWGLVGQQPGATGPVPQSVHGPISIGPTGIRGVTNRVYFGHGTGSNGILQIVDRLKLLDPANNGCSPSALFRTNPTQADLLCPQLGRLDTSPTMGAHTVFPLLRQPVPEFARNAVGGSTVRDFIVLVNEAGGNTALGVCERNRQLVYFVDISTESKPMAVSNFQVSEASGDFCTRGGRFGAHASNESFTPTFYGKLVFVSWFNAGVRAIDVREPFSPREVGFFIPATTANTDVRTATVVINGQTFTVDKFAIQTNNVEVDERGFIYIVDRANTGLHILELDGDARKVIE